jgi:hypothetical protein
LTVFEIGHAVRIKDSVTKPKCDWGGVDHFSRGVITDIIPTSDTEAAVVITFYGLKGYVTGYSMRIVKTLKNIFMGERGNIFGWTNFGKKIRTNFGRGDKLWQNRSG